MKTEREALTKYRFQNPRLGDTFNKMFSFWIWVSDINPDGMIIINSSNGLTETLTPNQYTDRYKYKNIDGYSVSYAFNEYLKQNRLIPGCQDVTNWGENADAQKEQEKYIIR